MCLVKKDYSVENHHILKRLTQRNELFQISKVFNQNQKIQAATVNKCQAKIYSA